MNDFLVFGKKEEEVTYTIRKGSYAVIFHEHQSWAVRQALRMKKEMQ